jgi:hypothetical protein
VNHYDLLIEAKVHHVSIAANLYHQPITAKLRHLFHHLFTTETLRNLLITANACISYCHYLN